MQAKIKEWLRTKYCVHCVWRVRDLPREQSVQYSQAIIIFYVLSLFLFGFIFCIFTEQTTSSSSSRYSSINNQSRVNQESLVEDIKGFFEIFFWLTSTVNALFVFSKQQRGEGGREADDAQCNKKFNNNLGAPRRNIFVFLCRQHGLLHFLWWLAF